MSYAFMYMYTVDREIFVVKIFSYLPATTKNARNLFAIFLRSATCKLVIHLCCAHGPSGSAILQGRRWTPQSQNISVALRSFARYCLRESGGAPFDKRRAEAEGKKRGPYRRYSTAQKNALSVRQ